MSRKPSKFLTALKAPPASVAAPVPPQSNGEPKKPRFPVAVQRAIEDLATGRAKTIQQAADRQQKDRGWLSKWLSRPEVIAAAKERAAKAVAIGALRSGARLNELVDHESGKVSIDAVKYSLGSAGIGPAQGVPSVNINIDAPRAGYVLDLSGRRRRDRSFDADGRLIESGPIIDDTGQVIDVKPVEPAD